MVGSIMIVGMVTYALLHYMCDLRAAQMKVQYSLIQELIFYKYEVGYNAIKATKNICCAKSEDTLDHSTITRWFGEVSIFNGISSFESYLIPKPSL